MSDNKNCESMTPPALNIALDPEEYAGPPLGKAVVEPLLDEEQNYRAAAYGLLAALLRSAPDQALLDHTCELSPSRESGDDDLLLAMSTLALSAQNHRQDEIDDEFHALFIGLGKGEVVPYGSWYLTGFLMEQPLSDLREDLRLLGFDRSPDTHEPEDHVAALCEVLAIMISEAGDLSRQQYFFETHMQKWIGRFFDDLARAQSAVFYRSVARFGSAFIAFENTYFSMRS